jgi:hypothetical protein
VINPKDIIQSSSPISNISLDPSAPTPVASTPAPPPPPETITIDHRPIAITILLWMIFADITLRIGTTIYTIITLISSFRLNHLIAHLYETTPLLCFSPLFYAIIAVIILFLIFKTSSYSFLDYRLILIFSIIIPISFTLFTRLISTYLKLHPLLSIISETNLLFIIVLIFLAVSSHNFPKYVPPISDGASIMFTLLGSIILFPSFFFTYYLINTSLNPDTKFAAIQTLAGFKLYSPVDLPLDLRPDSTFYIDDKKYVNLPSPSVKIAYSTPVSSATKNRPMVLLSQTKVSPEFDLENYTNSQLTSSSPQNIELSTAINQKAIIKSNDTMTSLSFITSDYVLINLISPSPDITSAQLISIAESLR